MLWAVWVLTDMKTRSLLRMHRTRFFYGVGHSSLACSQWLVLTIPIRRYYGIANNHLPQMTYHYLDYAAIAVSATDS